MALDFDKLPETGIQVRVIASSVVFIKQPGEIMTVTKSELRALGNQVAVLPVQPEPPKPADPGVQALNPETENRPAVEKSHKGGK